jgi:hypothetical protein
VEDVVGLRKLGFGLFRGQLGDERGPPDCLLRGPSSERSCAPTAA